MGYDTKTGGLRRQQAADLFHSARTNDHLFIYWDPILLGFWIAEAEKLCGVGKASCAKHVE